MAEAHLQLFDAFVAQRRGKISEAHAQAYEAATQFEALKWNAYVDLARSILPLDQRRTSTQIAYDKPFLTTDAGLTEREREVATLVLKGLTSRAIADKLSISRHTVDSHVNSIMNRLGIHSRHQLAYVLPEHS
jgi:DNA-binding NarL/FixJ family response regulator